MFPSVEHVQVCVGRVGKACFAFGNPIVKVPSILNIL